MRNYLGLSLHQTGVLITRVLPLCPARNALKKGDVLMSIDEQVIADNGTVSERKGDEGEKNRYNILYQRFTFEETNELPFIIPYLRSTSTTNVV